MIKLEMDNILLWENSPVQTNGNNTGLYVLTSHLLFFRVIIKFNSLTMW